MLWKGFVNEIDEAPQMHCRMIIGKKPAANMLLILELLYICRGKIRNDSRSDGMCIGLSSTIKKEIKLYLFKRYVDFQKSIVVSADLFYSFLFLLTGLRLRRKRLEM